jgi:ribonuclease VapC
MFVETSVVVAILAREPDAGEFVSKIERAGTALTAGHVVLEGSVRLSAVLGVGPLEAEAAVDAEFHYGSGTPAIVPVSVNVRVPKS